MLATKLYRVISLVRQKKLGGRKYSTFLHVAFRRIIFSTDLLILRIFVGYRCSNYIVTVLYIDKAKVKESELK